MHLALSAYQRDIWATAVRRPDHPQFTVVIAERLTGHVDRAALADRARAGLGRHEALRLRIADRDGTPEQWVGPDLPEVGVVTPPDGADAWIGEAARTAVALDGPLAEVTVLADGDDTVLVVKAHHIVADTRSLTLYVDSVLADLAGTPQPSAPSYVDFLATEAEYRASEEHVRDRRALFGELADATPALFSREVAAVDGGRHRERLDAGTVGRMLELGESPFSFFTAAVAVYLSRLHRAEEVVVGVPLLNRAAHGTEEVVGQFANTLPLRLFVHSGQTLRHLAGEVRAATSLLKDHERLALGDLIRELPAAGGRTLFDVTVSYLRHPEPVEIPGVGRATTHAASAHESDALAIHLHTTPDGGIDIDFAFAADVFDGDLAIEAAAGHVLSLLRHGLAEPARPVTGLVMTSEAERAFLAAVTAGPSVAHDVERTVVERFEDVVDRTPDAVAVAGALTYAELDAQANQVARGLIERGIGPGDRVAVLHERDPRLIVALYGVLKAGAAYVPIDPAYPADRVSFLLTDSAAKVTLTGPGIDVPGVPVTDLLHGPAARPGRQAGPDDVAYVIYTSGTTGNPKGVMVEHRSVVNRLAWMQRAYPIGPGDVVLQKTPTSFDVSVWELFWWGIEGAAVSLLAPGAQRDPERIIARIAEHRVTVLHFVPSMFGPFLRAIGDRPGRTDLGSLRRIFCSGEALPPGHVELCARTLGPGVRLVNLYGPTEATVDVSYHDCDTLAVRAPKRVPIGKPIDNTSLYVLDPHGNHQPAGLPGELCVAGINLARGYLDRPELTDAKFVAAPFAPGERIYRTGDLARLLSDGSLEYLGRLDDQVKIRGNRVELGEVRDALAALAGVREAVVIDRTDEVKGTHLVGYYVSGDGAEIAPATLRAGLAESLPDYMIPSRFLRIDRIPLTPNGKTNRRALPEPGAVTVGSSEPSSPVEAVLAEVWADVLGVPSVGVRDNYFVLGGDSILMLRVRAEAGKRGVRFSLSDLLRNPTVADLASVAGTGADTADPGTAPFALVSKVDRSRLAGADDAFPVTRLQLGMLFHSRRNERSALYRDVFRYGFELEWSEPEFVTAVERVVARHPALRSSFALAGHAEPLQVVHPSVSGTLEIVDLREHTAKAAEAEIARHIEERRFHDYRFDVPGLYLFRVHLLQDSVELVVSFHHAVLDGGSMANVLREIVQGYLHGIGKDIPAVPEPELPSPAEYAQAERAALESEVDAAYWAAVLDDAPRTRLEPTAQMTGPGDGGFFTNRLDIDGRLTSAVRGFAAEHAVPVKSVLFAAHCLALRLFTGSPEIVTGLVTHGRPERAHAERVVGLFLNTLPTRVDTGGTWLDAVRAAFRREQDDHPHRRYPLSAIQDGQGGEPVFDTAFNYVHFHVLEPLYTTDGVLLREFRTWEQTEFTLLVNAFTDPGDRSLYLRLDYDGASITPAQAALFEQAYAGVLERIVEFPYEEAGFDFLAEAGSPRTAPAAAPEDTVARWFVERAEDHPGAIALIDGGEEWTYRRLHESAASIAGGLLAAGLRRGAPVGIALPRSAGLVAAVLGVALAGGASLPLDVGYPEGRLAAMVRQAAPVAVITGPEHARIAGETPVLDVDALLATPPAAELEGPVPESTAYVLFTSGSTGEPKGVAMPHRSLANLVAWQNSRPSGAVGGRTLQFAPLSFDVSFQEVFSTLCGGGTLVLVDEDTRRDLPGLLRLIDGERVERIYLPYVALQQLAETAVTLGIVPSALKVINSSGEQLRVTESIRGFCAGLPGVVVENQYGPTESHVVTASTLTGDPARFPALPPIGTAVAGSEVLVLDERRRPVPPGAKGEIHLGGVCLADGYVGRPDLTDERFVPHPLRAGERLYRTGDLGIVLPDGAVACLGRADSQVKVRGFRVEPAEVEFAIAKAGGDAVHDVAVVAIRRDATDAHLVAFLVGTEDADLTAHIRKELRATLPDHLIPGQVQWIDALPLTPSGKRDDRALRATPLRTVRTEPPVAPRDDYERVLLGMVEELLRVPGIGVRDDVFALGGTSLTAMRLVVLIERRYGVSVPLGSFVAAPTVADLAALLRTGGARAEYDPLVPINRGDGRPLFLVHPMGGNVLCYLPLARHLPAGLPVYGLQAAGTDPGSEPIDSVERIAAAYVTAIRRVQPNGPYSIGGWSFGGFVSFEVARQLREAGEEIADLLLIDSIAPSDDGRSEADPDALIRWFFWELLWLEHGGAAPVTTIPEDLTGDEKFAFIADLAVDAGVLPPGSTGALVRRLFTMFAAHWEALRNYRPPVVDQDMTLLHATGPLPPVLAPMHDTLGTQHRDPGNGWTRWTGGHLDIVDVPGDHLDLMEEPNVRYVAKVIARALDHAEVGK